MRFHETQSDMLRFSDILRDSVSFGRAGEIGGDRCNLMRFGQIVRDFMRFSKIWYTWCDMLATLVSSFAWPN